MTTATTDRRTTARQPSRRRAGMHLVDVAALVELAVEGDSIAWEELVDRYQPLVASVARRHRLSAADADDVSQRVWLLLLTHLGRLRQPERLPGWLATTSARECLRSINRSRRHAEVTALQRAEPTAAPGVEEDLLLARERRDVVRRALARLSSQRRRLVEAVVLAEVPYAVAANQLGVPIGSVGPTRGRALDALARMPELVALG